MRKYPIRIEGTLDPSVSRWLWLMKWLLAIPHYIVLAFLWLAFAALSLVAFFAVLFTGRYPRSIFAFTTGVLRWSWRVGFYAYGALGTDRYPPFTLDDVPDYPARLHVDHPPRLSRGLVLVKWLLAVPHLLVVAVLLGGGLYLSRRVGDTPVVLQSGGLIGLLVLVAGFVLLFTGRYPRELFDLVIGLNRWVYRVAAYLFLMTDEYPPFRLDTGSGDTERPAGSEPPAAVGSDPSTLPQPGPAPQGASGTYSPAEPPLTHRWTAGRVVSVVTGAVLLLLGLGALPAGGALLWLDQAGRDSGGYVSTDPERFSSPGYALRSEPGGLRLEGPAWVMDRMLGEIRITGTSRTDAPLFIGIAADEDVATYLRNVNHTVVSHLGGAPFEPAYREQPGDASIRPPGDDRFWVAEASGTGTQSVRWQPRTGDWTVVVLNADGSRAVQADLTVGVSLPSLDGLAFSLIGLGLVFLLAGGVMVSLALRSPHRDAVPPSSPDAHAGATR